MKIILPVAVAATVLLKAFNLKTSERAGLVYAVVLVFIVLGRELEPDRSSLDLSPASLKNLRQNDNDVDGLLENSAGDISDEKSEVIFHVCGGAFVFRVDVQSVPSSAATHTGKHSVELPGAED